MDSTSPCLDELIFAVSYFSNFVTGQLMKGLEDKKRAVEDWRFRNIDSRL